MSCPQCRQDNPPGAKFCSGCGGRLEVVCPGCGHANLPGSRFCNECGRPVAAPPVAAPGLASPQSYMPRHLAERILSSRHALEGERKQVTVLFADMKGSLELLADRDPEDARKLLDPVLECLMEAVHRYEGTVNQVMGDGIMALFGAPLAHEDHAVRACYAALAMQQAIRRYTAEVRRDHGIEVQIRVGLNSGEVVVRAVGSDLRMDYSAVGQTTHLAARMEQLATPGSTRLTGETLRLAEGFVEVVPIGPVPVKGLASPVEVFELAGPSATRTRLQAAAARGLTRFVGRTQELDHLRQALDKARGGQGQVVSAVGEPGVGKSRLVWEFIHSHRTQGWLVLESSSVSYGKASAYLPVIDLCKSYFRIEARDDARGIREKVTGKLLTLDESLRPMVPGFLSLLDVPTDDASWDALDPGQRRRRTIDGLRRMLLRESQVQPLCLVFEDLHWVDAETQGLLDALVESLPTARILLLVNYRPEYRHAGGARPTTASSVSTRCPPRARTSCSARCSGTTRPSSPSSTFWSSARRESPSSSRRACARSSRPARWPASAAAIAWRDPPTPFRCRPRCRPSSRPGSIASLRTTRPCSRPPPSSARTCRSCSCRPSPRPPRRRSVRASGASRAPSSCTRPPSSPSSSTRSSTRSPRKWRTAGSSRSGDAICTPGSCGPSRRSTRGAPASGRAGSRFTPFAARSGIVRWPSSVVATSSFDGFQSGFIGRENPGAAWWMGDHEHAIRAAQRELGAVPLSGPSWRIPLAVAMNLRLGQAHHSLGQYSRAMDALRKNLELLVGDLLHDPCYMAGLPSVFSRAWLAYCLAERGEFGEGTGDRRGGHPDRRGRDPGFSLVVACAGLGNVCVTKGDFARAVAVLEPGLSRELGRGHRPGLALPRVRPGRGVHASRARRRGAAASRGGGRAGGGHQAQGQPFAPAGSRSPRRT